MTSGRRCEFSLRGDVTVAGVGSTWALLASVIRIATLSFCSQSATWSQRPHFRSATNPSASECRGENVEKDEYVER